jgi:glycosyltransferase involved in cell wall biosynthesis
VRVIFVPHAYHPSIGGAQRYARGLAEGLVRRGHEVHVVVADLIDPEAFYELGHRPVGIPTERLAGVTIHRLPYRSILYRLGAPRRFAARALRGSRRQYEKRLRDRIADLDPEVVVTLPHLFPNVEEVAALRPVSRWRLVYAPMLHEDDPYWSIPRVAAAVAVSDGVVALTAHEQRRLVDSYGITEDRTAVIPPGVDVADEAGETASEPVVLSLGRRSASKRLDILYEAMGIVWQALPEAMLVVAGAPPAVGPDPADAFRHDTRVQVIDGYGDHDHALLLRRARLLASASTAESFGITTLEAWAHGTPVVVADTPVARSVVRDGIDGLLADPDAAGIGRAILSLLSAPDDVVRMGREGRRRAVTDFSWDGAARGLDELMAR